MLSARITPSLVKYAQVRYSSYQPVLMQSVATSKLIIQSTGRELPRSPENGVNYQGATRYSNAIVYRAYASDVPSKISKIDWEKSFFKVAVVIWDLSYSIIIWTWTMFKKHIMLNPTVQSYWKTFNNKLDDARKN